MKYSWILVAAAVSTVGCAARSGSGPRSEAAPTDSYQAGTTTANLDQGSTADLQDPQRTEKTARDPSATTRKEPIDRSVGGMQPASGPGTTGASSGSTAEHQVNDSGHEADNSRSNQRDRNDNSVTPTDQGGSETDRKITQEIRQAVVGDKSLSFGAKNVKIITARGKVTLRGPVKSETERSAIEAMAKQVAGVANVENLLEISK